jgi:hypothetical protein
VYSFFRWRNKTGGWNPRHRLRKPDNREKATAPEGQMYFATSRRLRSTTERTGNFSMVEKAKKGKAGVN